jgi:hypothetical protein
MHSSDRRRHLVQFVDHITYEAEFDATDAEDALAMASERFLKSGCDAFTAIETDTTDWTACELVSSVIRSPSDIAGHRPSSAPSRPPLPRTVDRACLVELLQQLRETTLSRATFDKLTQTIDLLRSGIEVRHAPEK